MGRPKRTTSQFIERAIEVHGSKYGYSKVVYIGNREQVIIQCRYHGDFFTQRPTDHLNGSGCWLCGMKKQSDRQASNAEEFIEKSIELYGELYDYSLVVYIKSRIKVTIICQDHGTFSQTPNHHLNVGTGCPSCT